jgi:hypothetical protein
MPVTGKGFLGLDGPTRVAFYRIFRVLRRVSLVLLDDLALPQ